MPCRQSGCKVWEVWQLHCLFELSELQIYRKESSAHRRRRPRHDRRSLRQMRYRPLHHPHWPVRQVQSLLQFPEVQEYQKGRSVIAIFLRLPLGLFLTTLPNFSDRPKQLLSNHAALTGRFRHPRFGTQRNSVRVAEIEPIVQIEKNSNHFACFSCPQSCPQTILINLSSSFLFLYNIAGLSNLVALKNPNNLNQYLG